MGQAAVHLRRVTFSFGAGERPLFRELSAVFPTGWTGIVGANGAGKTTLLKLACGTLVPQEGAVAAPGAALYLEQRTDEMPEDLAPLMASDEPEACRIRGLLGLLPEWPDRWETMSHGERKRCQIAVALWRSPPILAVDEPTNHIDADGRAFVLRSLRAFRGVGLLVSHDRELLDSLCRQTLFLGPSGADVIRAGYTQAREELDREEEAARRELDSARKASKKLRREFVARREEASRSHKLRSKKGIPVKDHDARFKKNIARMTNKDGSAGRSMRQIEGRLRQAADREASIRAMREARLGIWLPGSRSKRARLLDLPAGSVPLGSRRLVHPELTILPEDRIALVGPNGGGKSTLLGHLLPRLNVPSDNLTYLPQEISRVEAEEIMERLRTLSRKEMGHALSVVSRLGSRPERLLDTPEPSPGEIRKVSLALGISGRPHLIVMDEPTNHLDLPSIECLEQTLSGCPCALLLVSHDEPFLEKLTRRRWTVEPAEGGTVLRV
ncbi:MAG: ATP-binding cassette domain-containing protein [Planctomycetota bacterium]|jgi:ATPase subunit of ABC transporter with duplicated ATPase domains